MRALTLAVTALVFAAGVAGAESLAFDFDVDGDPGTIDAEVTAEVGEIVQAYLVIDEIPPGHDYVHGFQYGLALSDGLEFVGMSVVGLEGGMGNDGTTDGIIVTLDEPMLATEFPSFAMRFALKVVSASPQTAAIAPSTGWGNDYDGFLFLVSTTGVADDAITIEDVAAIEGQRVGRVNANPTPIEAVSWGEVKAHF